MLDLDVGILHDDLARFTDQTHGKHLGQFAASRLGQKPGRQPATNRMQLQLGDRPLEAEKQAPVRGAGIVHPIAVGDQAMAKSADVEKRIPVRTVAGEPGHVDRQNEPNLVQAHARGQFLKASPVQGGRSAQPKVGVDNVNVALAPTEVLGAGGQDPRGDHHHRDRADPGVRRPVDRVRRVELLSVVLLLRRRGAHLMATLAADETVPGFVAPVHRALTEPILLGGAPRAVAILNGTLAAALGLGLRLWIPGLLLWVIGHTAAVWAAKRDPMFVDVVRRHLRIPGHLGV